MVQRLLSVGVLLLALATTVFAQTTSEGIVLGGLSGDPGQPDASGRYFVVFHAPPGEDERQLVEANGARILYSYKVIPAYAVVAADPSVLNIIAADPRVAYVEPDKVAYALGTQEDPEISDPVNDHSILGDNTQDLIKGWIQQPNDVQLDFYIQVQDLSGVDPTTGDGLPLNGIWKFTFGLRKEGNATQDQYFVEMRKPETGAPTFNWGYIDGSISTTVGPADAGRILPNQNLIKITNSVDKFVGAPFGNNGLGAGDTLRGPFVIAQQLVGASGVGGALITLDRGPNTGGGRAFTLKANVTPFSANPRSLDFGSLLVGSTKSLGVVVTNSGSETMVISSVTSTQSSYSVSPNGATIVSGGNQSFTVTFSPTASGPHLGTLSFHHNFGGSPDKVSVKGSAFSTAEGEETPWGVDAVRAPLVWNKTTGKTVRVAVLDSGIDSLHWELDDRHKGGYNFVADNPHPWDGNGHGTHVAGTIAAELNGAGLMGVAHEADVYSLKVLSDAGSGFFSDVYAAIDWCLANGIRVANMSLGGRVYDPVGELVFQNAFDAGLLSIAASGNGEEGVGTPHVGYPAAYQGVVAVGAVGVDLQRAAFSDFGPNIELVAPGVDVRSSVPRGTGRDSKVNHAGTDLSANPLEFAALTEFNGITAKAIPSGLGLGPADFPAEVNGNIALIQRGEITFAEKVRHAQDAGAIGVIIYNNAAGNFNGTLGTERDEVRNRDWVTGVSLSQADGQSLVAAGTPPVTIYNLASDFARFQGTSMASPHAAAVAALVLGANPSLSNRQVRDILAETATDLGLPLYDLEYGHGLVNAEAAIGRAVVEPPVTRFECDDPRVSSSGGWHRVEDDRASNDHYCRNVGAGKKDAALAFEYQGRHLDVVIARGPRGGRAEVFIDDVSRGFIDFYRPPSDPEKPDNSGKKDLTFGQVVSFETSDGNHTFRLVSANEDGTNKQSMLYVDGFVIHGGEASGTGNPIDQATNLNETLGALAQSTHALTASLSTQQMAAVLEVATEDGDVDVIVIDPLGANVGIATSQLGATVAVHWTPSVLGSYAVVVTNKADRLEPYRLTLVRTEYGAPSAQARASSAPVSLHAIPGEYALQQNYPNPFNPLTNLAYELPNDAVVSLNVYDVLGRVVATLVNGPQRAGYHTVAFDGAALSSGVYIYRFQATQSDGTRFVKTHRMILMK